MARQAEGPFLFVVWIDGNHPDIEDAIGVLKAFLSKKGIEEYTLSDAQDNIVKLSMESSPGNVESLRDYLCRDPWEDIPLVIMEDELAGKLRRDAYPIVADIEDKLRELILRATIRAVGFDWWNEYIPPEVRDSAQAYRNRDDELESITHPLEYLSLPELVDLVTLENQEWSPDDPLTANDLRELFESSDSIDDVKRELTARTQSVSLWNDVLARYFRNEKDWRSFETPLKEAVKPIRDRVAHHRTITRKNLRDLEEIRERLSVLETRVRADLSPEELTEIQESMAQLLESFSGINAFSRIKQGQFRRLSRLAEDIEKIHTPPIPRQELLDLSADISQITSRFKDIYRPPKFPDVYNLPLEEE